VGVICPQANPAWLLIASEFIPAYLSGKPFNYDAALAALSNSSGSLPPQDPRTTEDCLFLDVMVPKKVYDQAGNCSGHGTGAPVLVWIYGGGYTAGDKSGSGDPAGLIKASQATGSSGVIYVSLNYRVCSLYVPTLRAILLTTSSWELSVGLLDRLSNQTAQPTRVCMTNV